MPRLLLAWVTNTAGHDNENGNKKTLNLGLGLPSITLGQEIVYSRMVDKVGHYCADFHIIILLLYDFTLDAVSPAV